MWFDPDVKRLNYDEHGTLLGEFNENDSILVILDNGDFYLTNFDANNHYEDNISIIEKYDENKVWTAVLFDADQQGYPYLKRFLLEAGKRKQNYLGDNPANKQIWLTDEKAPRFNLVFGGSDSYREPLTVDACDFIAVKGFKAKGKRLSTWEIDHIDKLEPLVVEDEEAPGETEDTLDTEAENGADGENLDPDAGKSQQQVIDEITGQLSLFNDEDN